MPHMEPTLEANRIAVQINRTMNIYEPPVVISDRYAPKVHSIITLNLEIFTYGNSGTMTSVPVPYISPKKRDTYYCTPIQDTASQYSTNSTSM